MSFYKAFQYAKEEGVLHKLDPRSKLSITIALFVISALSWSLLTQLILLSTCLVLAAISRVFKRCLSLIKTIAPLVILLIIINTLSGFGPERTATLVVRFFVMVFSFSLLFVTTEPDLFGLMMEKMRLPYSLSLAFSMSLRMIPLMAEQAQKIIDSQRARGLDLESGNFLKRAKNMIPILIPMVVLSIKRSVEIAEALEARGFGSERRTRYFDIKMSTWDYAVSALSLAAVALYILLAFCLGYTIF